MSRVVLKLLLFFIMIITLPVNADGLETIRYKNIKEGSKIINVNGQWSNKVNNKNADFFIKQKLQGTENFTEYYSPKNNISFSTGTQYEFLLNGKLYGYSNYELKFYEFSLFNNTLHSRELDEYEVRTLFPERKQIKISDFSPNTNSFKIKKPFGKLKLIVLNDTDNFFYNYSFYTNNSKFKNYNLKGFIDITKRGMIQFSRLGENSKKAPWYILLVR